VITDDASNYVRFWLLAVVVNLLALGLVLVVLKAHEP
jgi:hypothetical protein